MIDEPRLMELMHRMSANTVLYGDSMDDWPSSEQLFGHEEAVHFITTTPGARNMEDVLNQFRVQVNRPNGTLNQLDRAQALLRAVPEATTPFEAIAVLERASEEGWHQRFPEGIPEGLLDHA